MIDPRSDQTTGYHLFFEPSGELRQMLEQQIAVLAEKYQGPIFPPHITLLARIEGMSEERVVASSKKLAASLSPLAFTLNDWGRQPDFFKAFYIRIEETEEVMAAHAAANAAFDMQNAGYYQPHLSLYYGLPGDEARRAMIMDISYPRGVSFTADRVHLYKTEGRADEWEKIGEFTLGSS